MPSPPVEPIDINEPLQVLGVTKFQKIEAIFQIYFGDDCLLTVDIGKESSKTLTNLEKAAKDAEVDEEKIDKLKVIVPRDYPLLLTFKELKQESESKKDKESSPSLVVKLVKKNCQEFFLDNLDQAFAAIKVRDHIEVLPIKHPKFENWISKLYWDATYKEKEEAGHTLGSEALNSALRVLVGEAQSNEEDHKQLYIRVARLEDGTILYDLVNPKWEAIKITPQGWDVVKAPPIFKRRNHQRVQVYPDKNYPSDIFDKFISLLRISKDEDNKLLFQCYIISLFYYGIVHAALMLHGESGASKTTRQKMIRLLVDPSATLVLILPKTTKDAAHIIVSHYLCYFDNISHISEEMSDLLCTAITAAGLAKRKLYTDDDDIINNARHCLGITGVNLAATKTDLIDRGLIVEQDAIPETDKKREEVLYNKFYELRPGLLGYICDILVKVLKWQKEHPKGLELEQYPRLADFAEICEIISICIGNEPLAFSNAFRRNIKSRHRRVVNDSAVGRAIEIFMQDKGNWIGEMSDLLSKLRYIAELKLQLQSVKNAKYWPQTPNVLSRKINEIKDSLRSIGIVVERFGEDTSQRTYIIENKNFASPPKDFQKLSLSPLGRYFESSNNQTAVIKVQNDESDNFHKTLSREPISDKKVIHELGNYVAWDLEWDENYVVEAASFVDSNGNAEVKLRDRDFAGSEIELLRYTMLKMVSYDLSVGWNTQNKPGHKGDQIILSDLAVIHDRCKAYGIKSVVKLGKRGFPYIQGDHRHVDLRNVYSKEMVQDGMYKKVYRTLHLGDVSKALLGYGKYNNHTGADFKALPIEEQIEYALTDSKLVMDLSRYRDYEALDAMLAISEITWLSFERICQTRLAAWWGEIFDRMIAAGECLPYQPIQYIDSPEGAHVILPKKGFYHNVVVVDAQSLYPSVAIIYNLSFDTINCQCCKDDPSAKIKNAPFYEFTKDCIYVNPEVDWICKRRTGAFPAKLKGFKDERIKQKEAGNKAKAHALKILINGGYGVFGHEYFSYFDGRVSELVTATGRYTLSEMQQVANSEYGFDIIYGDTDSLFLNNTVGKDLDGFAGRFRQKYDISLEIKNKYNELLLGKKKHYIGLENGVPDSVGFEGEKSDRCEFFHVVYDQLIKDIFVDRINPLANVRKAFSDLALGNVDSKLLTISMKVGQDPDDYVASARIGKIARAADANQGDLVEFYSADKKKTGKSWTLNPAELNVSDYKQKLWNTLEEILDIAGYPVAELRQEFSVKPKPEKGELKKKRKKKPVLENYSIVSNNLDNAGGVTGSWQK